MEAQEKVETQSPEETKPMTVLLAGASGAVGWEILRLLHRAGHRVITLSRNPQRAERLREYATEIRTADATRSDTLRGICDGIDVVVSALGASVALKLQGWSSYYHIDAIANVNLLEEARQAGVPRFIYVAAESGKGWAETDYIKAHEAVVERLREDRCASMSHTIVRPTGIYTALHDFIKLAKLGVAPVIGDGKSLTNPVHPTDVAEVCVASIASGPAEISVGGPEVMSRLEIVRKAFAAVGKSPRLFHVPAWVFRLNGFLLSWLHPRLSQLMAFVAAVSTHDAVAPKRGERTLDAYFQQLVKRE